MPSLFSKLRSFKTSHSNQEHQQPPNPSNNNKPLDLDLPKRRPQTPDWTARRTFSISPKLRTFFDPPQTPTTTTTTRTKTTKPSTSNRTQPPTLGVLDSPPAQSPQSPNSAYSGVVTQVLDVEILRKVSGGKVRHVELIGKSKSRAYESACAGTQMTSGNEEDDDNNSTSNLVAKTTTAWLDRWETLHSSQAGLLFFGSAGGLMGTTSFSSSSPSSSPSHVPVQTPPPSLPFPPHLLNLPHSALTAFNSLQVTRQRTATLHSYQSNLRKRKGVLKGRLQEIKSAIAAAGSSSSPRDVSLEALEAEKKAVERELVAVWELEVGCLDERLRCEERLEGGREGFEGVVGGVLGGFKVGGGWGGWVIWFVVVRGRVRVRGEVSLGRGRRVRLSLRRSIL